MDTKKIIEGLINSFLEAGEISLTLRKKGLKKEIKSDNTPVSNGDLEVNNFITQKISEITPDIPIISEETSDNKDNTQLKNFWLVDPIDGTYDYINNLEEFTINAGLIINNVPAAGLIYAPAKKRMFYSYGPGNAFELTNGQTINLSNKINKNNNPIKFISYSNKIKPEIQKIYQDIGYSTYSISATNDIEIETVKSIMQDKVSMFSGHSGVGKSTLVNAISPDLNIKTAAISKQHQQGMHTTTYAEMFALTKGIKIIDTPGIKGFGVVDMKPEEIGNYFPEFHKRKNKCKFHNCLHHNEPKCAIIGAVEAGKISSSRYASYLQMLEDDTLYRN